ncbi:MAG: hypothetical protein ACOVLE_04460, partial [Pirellula staleyi]
SLVNPWARRPCHFRIPRVHSPLKQQAVTRRITMSLSAFCGAKGDHVSTFANHLEFGQGYDNFDLLN